MRDLQPTRSKHRQHSHFDASSPAMSWQPKLTHRNAEADILPSATPLASTSLHSSIKSRFGQRGPAYSHTSHGRYRGNEYTQSGPVEISLGPSRQSRSMTLCSQCNPETPGAETPNVRSALTTARSTILPETPSGAPKNTATSRLAQT